MRSNASNALVVLLTLASLGFPWIVKAQGTLTREIEINRNVRLIVMSAPTDMPEELAGKYQRFLPMLEEVLKAITSPESPECALTIRVAAGYKEIGTAKAKRVFVRITAYRRNASQEFVARLYLHSFASNGPVSKKETEDFVRQRILGAAQCRPELTKAGSPSRRP